MSMLIIHKLQQGDFVIIPYKRPKWDNLHYASSPVDTLPDNRIEMEVFQRLEATLIEDKEGVSPQARKTYGLTVEEEKKLLTNASAVFLGAKGVLGGFDATVAKFTPCTIKQRRLHRILDKDPALNIELEYPMKFEEFVKAFRLAFERAH